jgi:DNA-binding LacI/PurR family transcriptional regulator
MAGWPHYALTTFRQPLDEIVSVVIGMLEDGSCQPGQPSSIKRISSGLVVRESTGPMA